MKTLKISRLNPNVFVRAAEMVGEAGISGYACNCIGYGVNFWSLEGGANLWSRHNTYCQHRDFFAYYFQPEGDSFAWWDSPPLDLLPRQLALLLCAEILRDEQHRRKH